jgi:hypothetical protein
VPPDHCFSQRLFGSTVTFIASEGSVFLNIKLEFKPEAIVLADEM